MKSSWAKEQMVFLPPCQSAAEKAEKQIEEEIGMFLLLYKIFNMALGFLFCFFFGGVSLFHVLIEKV